MKNPVILWLLIFTIGKAFSSGKPFENSITTRIEAAVCVYGASGAGIGAALVLRDNKAVQDINRTDLITMLREHGQKLV